MHLVIRALLERNNICASVYGAILPIILLTLTVSTEPVASFFSSSRLTRSSRLTDTSGTACRTFVPENGHEKQKFAAPLQTFLEGPLCR
jgi:hypothetical protein